VSDPILSLGRKLVAALKTDDDDLLSHWMAHHIAELIAECDTAEPVSGSTAKDRCANAIVELWSHRASLPGAARPFQELAPIIETLRALDPEGGRFFYERMMPNVEGVVNEETTRWLNFAKNCDAIARMLIGIGIDKASKHAGDDSSEWVDAASKAGLGLDFDIQLSDFLASRLTDATQVKKLFVQELKGRIEKLATFLALASTLRSDLQQQLEHLESVDPVKSKAYD
jgi:hypothetical protein